MTTKLTIKQLFICLLAITASGFFACKKEKQARRYSNDIYGPWQEPAGERRYLSFTTGGEIMIGVPDDNLELQNYFGTFTVRDNSLSFKLTETADKYFSETGYNKTPLPQPVESSATYKVQGDSLVVTGSTDSKGLPLAGRLVFYRPVEEL